MARMNFGVSISAGTVCDLPARVVAEVPADAVPACRRARVHPTQQPGVWLTVQNVCVADPETDQDSLSYLQASCATC